MYQHNKFTSTQIGAKGETIAEQYLIDHGYQILEKNWRIYHLEVDIIAFKNNVISIFEVKLRKTDFFGSPESFVSKSKQQNLIKAAHYYMQNKNIDSEIQFDILSIIYNNKQTKIEHIIQAFEPQLSNK